MPEPFLHMEAGRFGSSGEGMRAAFGGCEKSFKRRNARVVLMRRCLLKL